MRSYAVPLSLSLFYTPMEQSFIHPILLDLMGPGILANSVEVEVMETEMLATQLFSHRLRMNDDHTE